MRNMAFLELVPVVLALFLWSEQLKNKRIIFHIDNLALVSILSKGSSKDPAIMRLIRLIVLFAMLNNIQFKALYITSSNNKIADALSRFQIEKNQILGALGRPNSNQDSGRILDNVRPVIENLATMSLAPNTLKTY